MPLTLLGAKAPIPFSPSEAVLETFLAPHEDALVVRFTCPEFTSLCPVTEQPDFAKVLIEYWPDKWCLESKSLKLLLASYRQERSFAETLSVDIGKRLVSVLSPRWIRVSYLGYPRGGIPVDVIWESGIGPVFDKMPFEPTISGR